MAKHNSRRDLDRNLEQYRTRTAHSEKNPNYQHRQNQVQVAESSGCCSSRTTNAAPERSAPVKYEEVKVTAHDRTHARLITPEPEYRFKGRNKRNNQVQGATPRPQQQQDHQQNRTQHQQQQARTRRGVSTKVESINNNPIQYQNQNNNSGSSQVRKTKDKGSSSCTIL